MPTVTQNEAVLLACVNRLDSNTLLVMRAVAENPNTQHAAPRLRDWLSKELTDRLQRLESEDDSPPRPMRMEHWTNADVGDALVVAAAMIHATVTERQQEFVLALWQTVSVHAACRLKYSSEHEKKVAPWN